MTNVPTSPPPAEPPRAFQRDRQAVLKSIGICNANKIANTLQGEIWTGNVVRVENNALHSGKRIVIKIASKALHSQRIAIVNQQKHSVCEDIMKEVIILRHLHSLPACPPSIIAVHHSFQSPLDYYIVMEHGGVSLSDFVAHAHQTMYTLPFEDVATKWMNSVKLMFNQIVEAVKFLHSHHVYHFDLSLDNMTLLWHPQKPGQGQVKLIDFGLAEKFAVPSETDSNGDTQQKEKSSSRCRKFCGKRKYMSMEAVHRQPFDAAANDLWCLGVCLFIMSAGTAPWTVADESDIAFEWIMHGRIGQLLRVWQKDDFFDDNLLDLLARIWQPESRRISIELLSKHKWTVVK